MTLPVGDLLAAIERNDGPAVSRHLRAASEAERRAVSSKVRALCGKDWNFHGDRSATVVAMLGTAGGVRPIAQVIGPLGVQQWTEEAVAVLRERKPAWLPDLPPALLTGNEFRNQWRFVRALIRAGLVAKPEIPEYITEMPRALASGMAWHAGSGKSIEDQLLEDPALLEDEVFQLFKVEGAVTALYWADLWISPAPGSQWSETAKHKIRPEASWRSTLARLARRGQIDFDRLLDENIAVFLRDLRPSHFGWYVRMHEELAPTLDEMAVRTRKYERLLAADTSLGVGVGQRALEQLLRADRLDAESFVRASGPALVRGEKGIVVKQLKLLGQAVKQRPELAPHVAEVLGPALVHERPEIQEAAREFAQRLPAQRMEAPATPSELRRRAQAPEREQSNALARAARLVDDPAWGPSIESALDAIERGVPLAVSTIPVGAGRPLPVPISDPDEVVEAFTRLIENAGDPVLIERALAGAVRTARVPVAQRSRLAAPLAKRAREQLPGWPSGLTSADVRAIIASVAYTWATGERVTANFGRNYTEFAIRHSSLDEHFQPVTPTGVLAVRCIEAIDLIAKGSATELLAEPTHDRGAVEPSAFVERAQKSFGGWFSSGLPRFDLETAVLRMRPGALDAVAGELPRAVRDQVTALLREVAAWLETEVVSDKPKDQWGNAGSVVVLARVAEIGSRSTTLKRLTNLADPIASYLRLSAEGEFTTGYGAAIRTWPLIAPWVPDLTAAHLLRPLSRALQPGKHDHGPAAVACLLHPDTPLGKIGHLALAMGCTGAEGDTRTSAGDVFAAAAKDGRLQPPLMAEAWLELARAGAFQAKRLESTLRPVSSVPACGLRLAQTLQLALGPLVASGVREMHVLIRLAASLGDAYGLFPDDPRLVTGAEAKSSTELAKALRALAGARSSEARMLRAASVELLEGLGDRVNADV